MFVEVSQLSNRNHKLLHMFHTILKYFEQSGGCELLNSHVCQVDFFEVAYVSNINRKTTHYVNTFWKRFEKSGG